MSLLKRNDTAISPSGSSAAGNSEDLTASWSLSSASSEDETTCDDEDTTRLFVHQNDDEHDESEEECNPFIEGEQKLVILRKDFKIALIGTTVVTTVWAVLGGISIGIYADYRKKCATQNTFGMFGICMLIYMMLRYMFIAIVLGVALYHSSNKREFEKLANQYNAMLEKVSTSRNESVKRHVTKGTSTAATKATIGMGQDIEMFNHVKRLTSPHHFNASKRRHHSDMPHNVLSKILSSAMTSMKNCVLMQETLRGKGAYSCSQKHDRDDRKYKKRVLLFLAGVDITPLLSSICYVFVGITAELPPYTENTVCVVSLAFNWTLVGIFILYSIVCCFPLFFRIFQKKTTQ